MLHDDQPRSDDDAGSCDAGLGGGWWLPPWSSPLSPRRRRARRARAGARRERGGRLERDRRSRREAACLSPSNDPLHEARMYAITHIAVHDALNAIHHRYQPYAFSGGAPRHTSVQAAVAAAAHDALVATLADLPTELFPAESGCATGRHRPRRRRLRGRPGGDPGRNGEDERDRRRPVRCSGDPRCPRR